MMNIEDDDVNLGLGKSFTNFGIRARVLSTSGAGVNADSRLNLAFPASDPLSELVWSPHNGLSLKRATSSAADNKPFLVWNVGPSSAEGISPLQSIRLKQSGDEAVLHADDMIIEKATYLKADLDGFEEEADENDAIHEENCMVDQTDGIAEAAQEIAERSKEETSAVIPETSLKKLEYSFAEIEDCSLREKDLPMSSQNCMHRESGKEKALSDGDIYGRSLDDEDESAESSNSEGLSSKVIKGKKRQIYDEGVMLGSKRMKKQIHGSSHGSPSGTRHDSSFLNWIANMTKVSPLTLAEGESLTCFKPQGESTSISKGFQTIFQSLYCRETDVLNAGGKKIGVSVEEESRECAVDELVSPDIPVAMTMSDVLEESDPLTSFWITRLSTKTPRSEKGKEIAEETRLCSTLCTKAEFDSRTNVVFPMEQKSSGTRYVSADSNFNAPMKESRNIIRKPVFGLIPTYQTWKFEISSSKRVPASSLVQRSPALMRTKDVDDGQGSPLCDIATLQNTAAQSEIFHAIRNLRLTRADILRWMNSNLSLSHLNGFYLRVRLGTPEAGLGGSSYHVACITGDVQDNDGCMSKKSILVDVGGIKSSVSSQYVSNHDFLEDEIKAWWWRTLDSGCRIPSLVELNSKLNDRKLLGF